MLGSPPRQQTDYHDGHEPGGQVEDDLGRQSQLEKPPGVEFVPARDAWDATTADRVVGGILTANPEVNIVCAANEEGTHGAVTAVKRLSKAGEAVVFGTDMNKKLADFLLADDGVLQAVTAQRALEIGSSAVRAAIDALDGKSIEKTVSLPGVLCTRRQPEAIEEYREKLKRSSQ